MGLATQQMAFRNPGGATILGEYTHTRRNQPREGHYGVARAKAPQFTAP